MPSSRIQQHGVTAPARRQSFEIAGVQTGQESRRVGPGDFDLAEGAGIEHAGFVAHRQTLARDRGGEGLAWPREAAGAFPGADVL